MSYFYTFYHGYDKINKKQFDLPFNIQDKGKKFQNESNILKKKFTSIFAYFILKDQ